MIPLGNLRYDGVPSDLDGDGDGDGEREEVAPHLHGVGEKGGRHDLVHVEGVRRRTTHYQ